MVQFTPTGVEVLCQLYPARRKEPVPEPVALFHAAHASFGSASAAAPIAAKASKFAAKVTGFVRDLVKDLPELEALSKIKEDLIAYANGYSGMKGLDKHLRLQHTKYQIASILADLPKHIKALPEAAAEGDLNRKEIFDFALALYDYNNIKFSEFTRNGNEDWDDDIDRFFIIYDQDLDEEEHIGNGFLSAAERLFHHGYIHLIFDDLKQAIPNPKEQSLILTALTFSIYFKSFENYARISQEIICRMPDAECMSDAMFAMSVAERGELP